MKIWLTEIRAINPVTGHLTTYCGDEIEAITKEEAQIKLNNSERSYMKIVGELVCEVSHNTDQRIDYDLPSLN